LFYCIWLLLKKKKKPKFFLCLLVAQKIIDISCRCGGGDRGRREGSVIEVMVGGIGNRVVVVVAIKVA
jgi:hypothetical protein